MRLPVLASNCKLWLTTDIRYRVQTVYVVVVKPHTHILLLRYETRYCCSLRFQVQFSISPHDIVFIIHKV